MAELTKKLPIKNPRRRISDSFPVWFKVFWKKTVAPLMGNPHHQTIIPATGKHGAWILGAQPDESIVRGLQERDALGIPKKNVRIISMLSEPERIVKDNTLRNAGVKISKMPWYDHGTLDLTTGKNQPVALMKDFQKSLYQEFSDKTGKEQVFYCHCMAGRSRSLLETMAFIYFYPDKTQLFDFDDPKWNEIKKTIPESLQKRLQEDSPSFYDIAEFIQLRRPKVKKLTKMDGDQAGLLGLMALSKSAEKPEIIQERFIQRLYRDARNVGLMLKAPLDSGFRDPADRKVQEENFALVYNAYYNRGINLLKAMVAPLSDKDIVNPEETFDENFRKLKPSEQARFAILMHGLEEKKCKLDKMPTSVYFAQVAVENASKLTAGDQIELLRTFGPMRGLDYKDAAEKISKGGSLDRYNAEVQLKELNDIASQAITKKKEKNLGAINTSDIEKALNVQKSKKFASLLQTPQKEKIESKPKPEIKKQEIVPQEDTSKATSLKM